MLPGHATPQGTARYRDRFPALRAGGHFRRAEQIPGAGDLWLSSIGLGTYLGNPDDSADQSYVEALSTALRSGINVLDTAINYRHQRSERNIGTALKQLVDSGEIQRDEVMICTKAGYLSFDGDVPPDPRAYFKEEYLDSGILDPVQLAAGTHCIAPAYLENQIERSRRNLGLETIDLFYLHNPESQLADVPPEVFYERMKAAFALLEQQVASGKLRYYGAATWNGFRVTDSARDYLDLYQLVDLARQVGGEQHHFRVIQLPYNLALPEAYGLPNQRLTFSLDGDRVSTLAAASRLGVAVMGSSTLYQARLAHGLPDFVAQILGMDNDAENAVQFSRSTPGIATSLIGMGQKAHVVANLKAARVRPTPFEQWSRLSQQH
jgi:aryl-alcohol dehydrogenase-like predicted oxidoreductase